MTGGTRKESRTDAPPLRARLLRSLRVRIAALLALSLLPIGAVIVVQTTQLAHEVERRASLSLLTQTEQATAPEQQILERALGRAEAVATFVGRVKRDQRACRAYLEDYLSLATNVTFVGFLPIGDAPSCSTDPLRFDLLNQDIVAGVMQEQAVWIGYLTPPSMPERPDVSILMPTYDRGSFVGLLVLSVPFSKALADPVSLGSGFRNLITFNSAGDILASTHSLSDAMVLLPDGMALSDFSGDGTQVFHSRDRRGEKRTFAVKPVVPNLVYALTTWDSRETPTAIAGLNIPTFFLPLLMVLASIAVAYFSVDRLVAVPVSELRRSIRSFSRHRLLPLPSKRRALTAELEELENSFAQMAKELTEDEARMAETLREKNVLLKEIHHRVKNNLQLISSIMNLQIRAAEEPETVRVLRRLQDRVTGLSAVHRALYQAENLSRANAGTLLTHLFEQLTDVGVDAERAYQFDGDFDDVILYPDQALPLSLLASEVLTNAVKNVGAVEGTEARVAASLKLGDDGLVIFECLNTVGDGTAEEIGPSSGLGSKLVRAFATQLNGTLDTEDNGGTYRVRLSFTVMDFADQPEDY